MFSYTSIHVSWLIGMHSKIENIAENMSIQLLLHANEQLQICFTVLGFFIFKKNKI